MRRFAPAFLLTAIVTAAPLIAEEPPAAPRGPRPTETSCFVCHSQLDGATLEPTRLAAEDVHFQKGLSCHDCHGGNPEAGADGDMDAAHDPKKGFKGKPARRAIPDFCGGCHGDAAFIKQFNPHARVDQLREYRTSVHGLKNAAGNEEVAVCADCHSAHGIRPIADPRSPVYPTRVADTCARCHSDAKLMQGYGLPADQPAEYRTSVHFRALTGRGDTSAPTCNDCHGSHGAVPPGVDHIANVCGSCHSREATLFRETEAKRKIDLEPCIRCVVCHSNHAVAPPDDGMLGVGDRSTCVGCHAEGDAGYKAAAKMADSIEKLKDRTGQARERLGEAERAGMEVSEDRFALQKADDSLVEARVLAHSFDLPRFLASADAGIAAADGGVAAADRAFGELRRRRTGLATSLVVIAAVILALVLKARQLPREDSS